MLGRLLGFRILGWKVAKVLALRRREQHRLKVEPPRHRRLLFENVLVVHLFLRGQIFEPDVIERRLPVAGSDLLPGRRQHLMRVTMARPRTHRFPHVLSLSNKGVVLSIWQRVSLVWSAVAQGARLMLH